MPLTAILLAAGYATRMYPLTHDTPKALLPLGGGMVLDGIVSGLGSEVTKCILVTNHKFVDQFRAWRSRRGMTLEIVDDGTERAEERLGAVRDLELARVQGHARGDLLVVGTDNLFKWPLADFIERARPHAPHPSVALWEAPSKKAATQFGVVTVDRTDRITAFVEKAPQTPSTLVAMCVYYFPESMERSIRQFLDEQHDTDAPGYFISWLVQRGLVFGITMPGGWYDIGTVEAYQAACREWQHV